MVMGLVSGLSLGNHSDSESFLLVHALFSQDGCQREGFWEVVGHVVSPFDLSWTLPVGRGLLVPCSLPGPPVVKQLMQMVTVVPGQGGRFQSVCFPNRRTDADAETPILWPPNSKSWLIRKKPDAGKDWRQEKRGTVKWLDGITNSMDMSLRKLQETVKDRKAWHAAIYGVTKIWTLLSDWTTTKLRDFILVSFSGNSLCTLGFENHWFKGKWWNS